MHHWIAMRPKGGIEHSTDDHTREIYPDAEALLAALERIGASDADTVHLLRKDGTTADTTLAEVDRLEQEQNRSESD